MTDPEFYHSGTVVPDIERAMARYTGALGVTWARVEKRVLDLVVDGEPRPAELLATYSVEGPPHLELIQDLHGDVWSSLGLDHTGFWVPDLPAAVRRMERQGFPCRVTVADPSGLPRRLTYHDTGNGWIELVDATVRPELYRWLAGGEYV